MKETAIATALKRPAAPAAKRRKAVRARPAAAKSAAVKPANKPAAKPAAKKASPARARPSAAAKPAAAQAAAAEVSKPPKLKLVRDSFTIPRAEYTQLDALKQRLVALARPAKKSEVLRAGIMLLAGLGDEALRAAMAAVPAIKTGRPKKAK